MRDMVYLRRAGGIPGGHSETALETIAHIARAEKVKTILIESNFGNGMFTTLLEPVLRRIYPCTVKEVRSTDQKERRIIDTGACPESAPPGGGRCVAAGGSKGRAEVPAIPPAHTHHS